MRHHFAAMIAAISLAFSSPPASGADALDASAVLTTYADIAEAGYVDSLATARALQAAVEALTATPSEENLARARAAWVAPRVPYQQTEAFRFGNPSVDA